MTSTRAIERIEGGWAVREAEARAGESFEGFLRRVLPPGDWIFRLAYLPIEGVTHGGEIFAGCTCHSFEHGSSFVQFASDRSAMAVRYKVPD